MARNFCKKCVSFLFRAAESFLCALELSSEAQILMLAHINFLFCALWSWRRRSSGSPLFYEYAHISASQIDIHLQPVSSLRGIMH